MPDMDQYAASFADQNAELRAIIKGALAELLTIAADPTPRELDNPADTAELYRMMAKRGVKNIHDRLREVGIKLRT